MEDHMADLAQRVVDLEARLAALEARTEYRAQRFVVEGADGRPLVVIEAAPTMRTWSEQKQRRVEQFPDQPAGRIKVFGPAHLRQHGPVVEIGAYHEGHGGELVVGTPGGAGPDDAIFLTCDREEGARFMLWSRERSWVRIDAGRKNAGIRLKGPADTKLAFEKWGKEKGGEG